MTHRLGCIVLDDVWTSLSEKPQKEYARGDFFYTSGHAELLGSPTKEDVSHTKIVPAYSHDSCTRPEAMVPASLISGLIQLPMQHTRWLVRDLPESNTDVPKMIEVFEPITRDTREVQWQTLAALLDVGSRRGLFKHLHSTIFRADKLFPDESRKTA